LTTSGEHLKVFEDELLKCNKCGNCRDICPVFGVTNEETMGTRGRLRLIKALLYHEIDLSPIFIDRMSSCLNCKACLISCPGGVDVSKMVISVKEEIAKKNLLPLFYQKIRENILKTGNPFGQERNEEELENKKKKLKKSENLYFVGCYNSYLSKEISKNTQKILKTWGYNFVTLEGIENCCGQPLKYIGETELAQQLVSKNKDLFQHLEAKTIFTSCAKCFYSLKENFSKDFKIFHTSQLFYQLFSQNNFKFKPYSTKVIYFEGCHLGRQGEVFEEPRFLLKAVPELNLLEFDLHHRESRCCGGPLRESYPKLAQDLATKRIKEAAENKVKKIITCCPACFKTLKENIERMALEIEVLDLSSFLMKVV